jgi:hypothetical protein
LRRHHSIVIGFAAAAVGLAVPLGLALGAAAWPHATTTPAAAIAWRNRLRETIMSRSITDLPRSDRDRL